MGQTCRWKGRGHTSCGLLESLALMLSRFTSLKEIFYIPMHSPNAHNS